MWPKKYKDYPVDEPLVQEEVEPGRGIVGCEMHEVNGWQLINHQYRRRKNFFTKLLAYFFKTEKESL